jgi:hypothetical protein
LEQKIIVPCPGIQLSSILDEVLKTKRFKWLNYFFTLMGIFSKLAFWKKEDDFNFDDVASKDMGQDLFKGDNLGLKEQPLTQEKDPFTMPTEEKAPSFSAPEEQTSGIQQLQEQNQQTLHPQQSATTGISARDVDLLSSKLDTIKALLNSMDQRMANLERSSGTQRKEKLW